MKRKMLILVLLYVLIPMNVFGMQIYIEKPTSEKINLEVESSDTIEAVKNKIYGKIGILPHLQTLIYNSKELEEGRTLADYTIEGGSTIYLGIIEEDYKVIFDANGGKFNDGKDLYIIEKWENGYEETLEKPTMDGYIFKGYYNEKNGGTKFELILAESGIDRDMTFYARWEENSGGVPGIPEDTKEEITLVPDDEIEENPNTLDNVSNSIFIGVISLIGLISLTMYLKKIGD